MMTRLEGERSKSLQRERERENLELVREVD